MYGLSEKAVVVVLWICGQLGACGELSTYPQLLHSSDRVRLIIIIFDDSSIEGKIEQMYGSLLGH